MVGQPVHCGDPQQNQGKNGVQHGEHALPRSPHGVVQGEHHSEDGVKGHDAPQIHRAGVDHRRRVGEQPHQVRPEGDQDRRHQQRPHHGGGHRHPDALPGTVQLPGADVLPHEGGDGVGKALDRQESQLVQTVAHIVPGGKLLAEGVDLTHHHHGPQGHQGHLDACRQSDAHDLAEETAVKAAAEGSDGDLGIAAVDVPEAVEPGKSLGDHRADGHAEHTPAARQHQNQIQRDVQKRRYRQEAQCGAAVAQSPQDTGVEVVADGAHQPCAHHREIEPGVIVGGGVHPQQKENGLHQSHCQQRHRDGADRKSGVDGVHRVPDPVQLPGAVKLGDDHCAAVGKAHEQRREHENHRKADAHGRQGRVAHVLAHHPAVHHVVELLEKAPRQQRQGKEYDVPGRAALRHIPQSAVGCVHGCSSSLLRRLPPAREMPFLYCTAFGCRGQSCFSAKDRIQ
ncbi:putative uncharacterized protein [Oscillibacter sp. CAG:155]|nr:putative uncharacterized protein [Oscillibacter sp. CAG:155]